MNFKKYIILGLGLLLTIVVNSQTYSLTSTSNYIRTTIPQLALCVAEVDNAAHNPDLLSEQVQYFDGLGRPIQIVQVAASPNKKDIIQPIVYDVAGREAVKYLPYTDGNFTGAMRGDALTGTGGAYASSGQCKFYQGLPSAPNVVVDGYPYAKTVFESSPLNRVLQQGAPGEDWQPLNGEIPNSGHVQVVGYQTNVDNEVLLFTVSGTALSGIIGNYAPNRLYVTQHTDEDKHISKEYKDKNGQVVLKRVVDGTTNLDTYYVYDDFGLLRFVLPPEATAIINKTRSATPPASGAVTNITASITKNVYENTSYVVSTGSTLTLGNGFYFKATPGVSFSVTNSGQLSQTDQYNLAYQYQYDERKRMIVKKIPGADEVFMVYDKRDRLVLTQDGKMRAENNKQWNFIKYDQLNRPVLTGVYIPLQYQTREQMQLYVNSTIYPNSTSARAFCVARDNSVAITGYTNVSFPLPADGSVTYLTATYYDTYGFSGCAGASISANDVAGDTNYPQLNGLVTGSKELVLNTSTDLIRTYLTTTNYYDEHYRVIQSKRDLYDGNAVSSSNELVSNKYDFVGKVTQTRQVQTFKAATTAATAVTTTVDKNLYYDHAGRLTKTDVQVDGDATGKVTVSELTYNEIGQLVAKKLHKTATGVFNQTVDFEYNIRGWLSKINQPFDGSISGNQKDLFCELLFYNERVERVVNYKPLYNGNISCQIWRNSSIVAYNYSYDAVNRLMIADFQKYNGSFYVDATNYEERVLKYDFNGNIKILNRTDDQGGTTGVNGAAYTYNYNGNQLKDINGGAAYGYDKNGNMTADGRTGNAFTYNMLNLPQKVSKGADNINYTYSATGQKLLKNYNGTSNKYYAGNMVYSNALDYIIFEEGVIRKLSGGYAWEYNLKDHLGNTRVVFKADVTTPSVVQTTDYYAFGQQFSVPSAASNTLNKYLYNGKELQDDMLAGSSLNMLDYGARFYDAQICRWVAIDPLGEKYSQVSPYVYCINNPIKFVDPDGRDIIVLNNTSGAYGFGHMAVLIGNDKTGWTFVSKDGRAQSTDPNDSGQDGTQIGGGKSIQTIIKGGSFETLEGALGAVLEKGYDQGFRIESSTEQDTKATSVATESAKTDFNVINSNCADVATNALESAGKNGGTTDVAVAPGIVVKTRPMTPNNRFDAIVDNNKGTIIEMQKKDEQKK